MPLVYQSWHTRSSNSIKQVKKNLFLSLHIYIPTYHITSNSVCTLCCCRTHGQSYKIKRAGIPIAEQSQPEPPPVPDFLTLQEMEAIDPYEFPVIYILIYNSSNIQFQQEILTSELYCLNWKLNLISSNFLCRQVDAAALLQLSV